MPFSPTDDPKHPKLTFTYFDHGTCTIKPFVRQLRVYQPLFEELGQFQMEYVALSLRNFAAAEETFRRMFPTDEEATEILPFGRDLFVRFITAQDILERDGKRFGPAELATWHDGCRIYRWPEHEHLYAAWQRSLQEFAAERLKMCGKARTKGRLSLHVLQESYPVFSHRYPGNRFAKYGQANSMPFRDYVLARAS